MREICHLQVHTCATTTATNKIEYTPLIKYLRKKNIRNLRIQYEPLKTLGKNDKHAMQFLKEDNKFT